MKIRKRRKPSTKGGWLEYWQLDKGLVNGRRVRVNYKTKAEAETALTAARQEKANLGVESLALPHDVRVAMLGAHKRLADAGATINQAVDFFLQYHQRVPDTKLDQAIVQLLAAKRAANLRERYIRQLEFVCNRFAAGRTEKLVKEIRQAEIEEWLNGHGWAPKTRKGYLTDLQTLFAFCSVKGWLIEDPAAKIQKPRLDEGRPVILTADQSERLMLKAQETDTGLCCYLGLALFAGIRPEEIERLPAATIDVRANIIRIPAEVSKTRRERDVDIQPNLKAWLKKFPPVADAETGRIALPNFKRRFDAVRKAAGLFDGWAHDVMRHTYGSFYVAKFESIGKAALQMGNSEPVIKSHYLEYIRDPKAVAKFWSIKPEANR